MPEYDPDAYLVRLLRALPVGWSLTRTDAAERPWEVTRERKDGVVERLGIGETPEDALHLAEGWRGRAT